jgi:hypothetical protein
MANSGRLLGVEHSQLEQQWLRDGVAAQAAALSKIGDISLAAVEAAKHDPDAFVALGSLIDDARKAAERMRYIYLSWRELRDVTPALEEPKTAKENQDGQT